MDLSSLLLQFFMLCKKDLDESENDGRWLLLRAKVYEEKIKAAFRLFRENGVEPILIKGWAIAREYPNPSQRVYSDIDFCVAPDLFQKCSQFVNDEEFKKLNIDLHCGLRHLDSFLWEDLFENSRLLLVGDVEFRVLCHEDHLRVLCVHWLTDGGVYKEKLLDIYYLIENGSDDFDWDRCLGGISEIRRGWVIKTIGITHRYYNLDVIGLPFFEELKDIPKWLIKTLEEEWATDTKLIPLHTLLGNRAEFWKQLKKRVPPNAIQATIDMEGKFDERPRFYYQMGSLIIRIKPFLKRVYTSLKIIVGRRKINE